MCVFQDVIVRFLVLIIQHGGGGNIKIEIKRLAKDAQQEDQVLFHVHELTSAIQDAISLLQNTQNVLLAKLIDSQREEKIRFTELLYVEYLV